MLTLKAPETFKAKTEIPTPGGKPVAVTLTFRHMTRAELARFIAPDEAKNRPDVDTVMEIVAGWENVDAEFSRDNVEALLEQYHGAGRAILQTYIEQLVQARLGN